MISTELLDGSVMLLSMDHVATHNALNDQLLDRLLAALDEARGTARAVVLRSAGSVFCSGGDLSQLRGDRHDRSLDQRIATTVEAVTSFPGPVAAAISGGCIGAGVDLALACDARIGDPSAYFAIPATRFGLLYNPVAAARMASTTSTSTMRRLLLCGERLRAEEALAGNLLTHLAEAGGAVQKAIELCEPAGSWPARAVAATKSLLSTLDRSHDLDTELWQAEYSALLASPERARAVQEARKALEADDR